MFYWIYNIPNVFLASLICVVCIGYTWLGILAFRPWIRKWLGDEPGENEFVSYFLSAYGVFYGLMLGLIAVANYQNFTDVGSKADLEVTSITALYRDISSYPEPARSNYQNHLREYMHYVVNVAWPAQQQGLKSERGTIYVTNFQHDLFLFEPKTKAEEIVHAETIRQFNVFCESREARRQGTTTALPALLWYVVIIGAALNFSLMWMFSINRLSVHLILSGSIAFFVGLMLFFIAAMDNPFRGELTISSEPYQDVLNTLMAPK